MSDSEVHRVAGLDGLRIFALLLITWQHAASVLGAYAETQWRGISPGQTGVAIFCAISGYLAFRTTPKNQLYWIVRRLLSIFPSYWLVTIVAFIMVLLGGNGGKQVTIGLFVSQMLGLGYFTHGWELVNVVSWFLSLILLCYALSVVVRLSGYPKLVWLLIIILAGIAVVSRMEVAISRHLLAFALGALIGAENSKYTFTFISVVLIGVGVFIDPQFFYSGCALLLLELAIMGFIGEPLMVRQAAKYSYEYFLVHGISLAVVAKVISGSIGIVIVGIVLATIVAMVLYNVDKYINQFLKNYLLRNKANVLSAGQK